MKTFYVTNYNAYQMNMLLNFNFNFENINGNNKCPHIELPYKCILHSHIEGFYNTVRIHSHCGYLSLAQFEQKYLLLNNQRTSTNNSYVWVVRNLDMVPIADDCPWTEDEPDKMIVKDTYVKMKCISCDHIADVTDWIIGEFAEEDGIKDLECPICNGAMKKNSKKTLICPKFVIFDMV